MVGKRQVDAGLAALVGELPRLPEVKLLAGAPSEIKIAERQQAPLIEDPSIKRYLDINWGSEHITKDPKIGCMEWQTASCFQPG
ncbi:MAG: hypothetical protein ACOYNL_08545 [Rickettsiales bacterium]